MTRGEGGTSDMTSYFGCGRGRGRRRRRKEEKKRRGEERRERRRLEAPHILLSGIKHEHKVRPLIFAPAGG